MRLRSLHGVGWLVALSFVGGGLAGCSEDVDYCDADGDGFRDHVSTNWFGSSGCAGPDCDDSNPAFHPGANDRVGDGIDQSCDEVDGRDEDGDRHASLDSGGDDCDDDDSRIFPGREEVLADGIDQDCDGTDRPDDDRDGHGPVDFGGDDCDDDDASIHAGASEVIGDGIDQDCDGVDTPDDDEDGHAPPDFGGDDCDDDDDAVFLGAEGDWIHEAVAGGANGSSPALAVDASGALHVAFTDADARVGVGYATDASGDWETSSIEPEGREAAIGLGPAGEVHVAWVVDVDPPENRYALSDGAGFVVESLGRHAGSRPALAMDGAGNPHVLVVDDSLDLRHGARVGGVWTYETVAEGIGGAELFASLAVDASGLLHATYFDWHGLEYARGETGLWSLVEIDGPGYDASLVRSPDGAIHVAYAWWQDGVVPELRHADDAKGFWQAETLDVDAGADASIVVGSDGTLHVAHHGREALRYASGTTRAWTLEVADRTATLDGGSSIALDPDGLPIIAYGNDGLWIARRGPADGVDNDCDGVAW